MPDCSRVASVVRRWPFRAVAVLGLVALLGAGAPAFAQSSYDNIQKARSRTMLTSIRDQIKKSYYDPAFRGIDLDAHFKAAAEKLERATTFGQAWAVIAQALIDFNDSHTYFVPPPRAASVEYGWRMQMMGDACYLTAVKQGSDAEAKGLKAGDRVLSVQGFKPSRDDLWKINYFFYTLNPMPAIKLTVQSPGAAPRQVEVTARFREKKRVVDLTGNDGGFDVLDVWRGMEDALLEQRVERLEGIAVWRMPHFELESDELDTVFGRLKGAASLVLDLRGNGGGYVDTLDQLAGRLIDGPTTIAEVRGRKTEKPIVSKPRSGARFAGRLVVLVDSRSGSASELLARTVQLQKRGTVIGDRSSGAVMRARYFAGEMGTERVVPYGASITDADLIMPDGQSLERVGVTPDELLLPTPEDLAASSDPVLARAVTLLGGSLDAKAAGAMFKREWK